MEILGSDKVLRDLIIELKEVQKNSATSAEPGSSKTPAIPRRPGGVEDVAITVTRGGYSKRTSVDTYRRQTRARGRIGGGTRAE